LIGSGKFGLLLFFGNQAEKQKRPLGTLRFVGAAVDEIRMAADKIVDHMSGIQREPSHATA
jgi:hypothetical protein